MNAVDYDLINAKMPIAWDPMGHECNDWMVEVYHGKPMQAISWIRLECRHICYGLMIDYLGFDYFSCNHRQRTKWWEDNEISHHQRQMVLHRWVQWKEICDGF